MLRRILASCLFTLVALAPALVAAAATNPAKIAGTASEVLKEILQQAPDRAIPKDLLRNAYAVAVIPDVVKVGLVLGGRHGEGLIAVKTPDGKWSDPAYVTLTGGSVGFQAGVSSTDVVLVFRTRQGVDSLVNGKFTLGVDAHAAAGPVGRNASAATDIALQSEIYSYSRSRGLFAGVALDGAVLRIDDNADAAMYGANYTARQIFDGKAASAPAVLTRFRDQLDRY